MIIDFAPPTEKPEKPVLARLLAAAGLAALAVVLGAVAWALVGYWAERISLGVAFAIGIGVALAYASPVKSLNVAKAALLFVPCVATTLASVYLGQYLLTALLLAREFECSLAVAAAAVAAHLELLNTGDLAVGVFLGVVGAVLGFANVVRRRR